MFHNHYTVPCEVSCQCFWPVTGVLLLKRTLNCCMFLMWFKYASNCLLDCNCMFTKSIILCKQFLFHNFSLLVEVLDKRVHYRSFLVMMNLNDFRLSTLQGFVNLRKEFVFVFISLTCSSITFVIISCHVGFYATSSGVWKYVVAMSVHCISQLCPLLPCLEFC